MCTFYLFASHRGGESPLGTSHSIYPARNTHEPAKWGKLSAAAGLSFTNMPLVGRLLHW